MMDDGTANDDDGVERGVKFGCVKLCAMMAKGGMPGERVFFVFFGRAGKSEQNSHRRRDRKLVFALC